MMEIFNFWYAINIYLKKNQNRDYSKSFVLCMHLISYFIYQGVEINKFRSFIYTLTHVLEIVYAFVFVCLYVVLLSVNNPYM